MVTNLLLIVLAVLLVLALNELAHRRRWFQPPETVAEQKLRVLYPAEWAKRQERSGDGA